MSQAYPFRAFQRLKENPSLQFWTLQILGWFGYSVVTFLTLTVWDENVSWSHVNHIALQAGLGMVCTWPLRALFAWAWSLSRPLHLLWAGLAIIVLSCLWTASRMWTFMWMSGERGLWREFNDWYFGSLFVFLSWTAIYYGIKYYRLFQREHEKLLRESARQQEEYLGRLEAESSMRDAQLQMLRYQLNPHFLFNTLNALNALVALGFTEKAQHMIEQLSKFLRHSLDTEVNTTVTVEEEVFAISLYLDIEQARFEDRLQVHYKVDPSAKKIAVPSLILQPLVENSMKYAIAKSEAGGVIDIAARIAGQRLLLEVSDSGPGMSHNKWMQGRGIGLRNTLDRLDVLYHGDFEFEASPSETGGLNICINIPITEALAVEENVQLV